MSELTPTSESIDRVAAALLAARHPHSPVMLNEAARTAQQAADALGVQLGQIAKSIVFKRKPDGVAVLVIAAGDRRVDEVKVMRYVCADGQKLGRADAAFVRCRLSGTSHRLCCCLMTRCSVSNGCGLQRATPMRFSSRRCQIWCAYRVPVWSM
jgi:hypothetical protein